MTDPTKQTIDEILHHELKCPYNYIDQKTQQPGRCNCRALEAKAALSALIEQKEDEAWNAGFDAGKASNT